MRVRLAGASAQSWSIFSVSGTVASIEIETAGVRLFLPHGFALIRVHLTNGNAGVAGCVSHERVHIVTRPSPICVLLGYPVGIHERVLPAIIVESAIALLGGNLMEISYKTA